VVIPAAEALGRGVVVVPGADVPGPWASAPRIPVGEAELRSPAATVEALHRAWLARAPVVVELGADADALRTPETYDGPVHALDAGFGFLRERLQFLVWANNYDGRSGELVWWHGRKAARRLADRGVREGGSADLTLADGTPCLVDGGPPHPPDPGPGTVVVHRWNAERGGLRAAGHAPPSSDLADDQRAAVAHPAGPVRVIAPAGSGKTRVLTERLRHLVVDRGVDPAVITVVAYNTKAADELRGRCADFLPEGAGTIRTLNSLGLWICNRLGPAGPWTVIDEPRVRALVQQVFEVPRQANADTVAPFIAALSAVRLGLRHPVEVEEAMPDADGVGDGFDRYRRALDEARLLDFDEQIYRAVEVLCTDPDARARAQARCRVLLVDEFQDLTPAHVLLLRLLSAPGYDCFGVGDDDQVIYGYSGADPGFLLEYGRYFPGASERALEVNYRCPPEVVGAAVHLLAYNRRRVPKAIRAAGPPDPGSLEVRRGPAEQLALEAVGRVRAWLDDGVPPGDIAVLARVNSALLPVQVAAAEADLPVEAPLGPAVLERTGVRTALAYLRTGLDPDRITPADVRDTIRRPSRSVAPRVVEMLTTSRGTSVTDIRRLAGRLTGRDAPKLEAYADDIERLAVACRRSTAAALRTVRVDIGLGGTMDVLDSSRREADRSTHTDDLLALESVAALHPDVGSFEPWLRSTLGRPRPAGDLVLLSTVHRIKGREWGHVVVFGASQGSFPHRLSEDEEGERRVFHVALTRTRHRVVVLAAEEAPSIFVDELDGSRVVPPPRPPRPARPAPGDPKDPKAKAAARSATGPAGPAEEALRAWRRTVAAAQGIPAYVVLNDRELVGIAERSPRSLSALASCPGIGSIRLERWGDEILAVLEGALGPA
jgi:DNA helicase-2/ATP-dependent DNA helicase PcrA